MRLNGGRATVLLAAEAGFVPVDEKPQHGYVSEGLYAIRPLLEGSVPHVAGESQRAVEERE